MQSFDDQLVAQLERALKHRAESGRSSPEMRAAVTEFLRLLQCNADSSAARGWLVVLERRSSQDVGRKVEVASVTDSAIADFGRALGGGGFFFCNECREPDLLGWLDLYVETRARKVPFVEAHERLRVATAHVLLSPPPDAPGWFGGYDFQTHEINLDLLAAPLGGRGGGSAGDAASNTPNVSDRRSASATSTPLTASTSELAQLFAVGAPNATSTASSDANHDTAAASSVGTSTAAVLRRLFDTVETAHGNAASNGRLDVPGARGTAEELVHSSAEAAHEVLREVQYSSFDRYTFGHSVRVALLAVLVGRELAFEERVLVELGTAGLLHDVGKARIDSGILFKPGRLDHDERLAMSKHPAFGAEILIEQADAGPLSVCAAFGHHLRHDGTGYPSVPRWYRSSASTAIVQVCDVFEALTAIRPYKAALSPRRAFEVMFADAAQFHPAALRALVRCMGLYPPGSRVKLSNGSVGIVLRAGADPAAPTVRITHDDEGRELPESETSLLDLALSEQSLTIANVMRSPTRPTHDAEAHAHGECCR